MKPIQLFCTAVALVLLTAARSDSVPGIDITAMDRSIAPGDDFYRYANGNWQKRTEIPADRAAWGAFNTLDEEVTKRTRMLIENAGAGSPPESEMRKVSDFYASFMDQTGIEARGVTPLQPQLASISRISSKNELAEALGRTLRADVDPLNNTNFHTENLFGIWVAPGFADSDHYTPYLLQGGLGMPDREFYLGTTERMKAIQVAYRKYIATILKLATLAGADEKASVIFDLETKIAKAHESIVDSQDVVKANNVWRRTEFPQKAPGLDWSRFFDAAGLNRADSFIVWQPMAFAQLSKLVADVPLDTWKVWLEFHLLNHFADDLPKAFDDPHFEFFGRVLSGTPQQQERWKRAVRATNDALGDAVGKLYAASYFPPRLRRKRRRW